MAYLEWNDSYSVKINSIDQQHKQLIAYINELHEAMSQGKSKQVMGDILAKLANYTVEHFTLEEKYMSDHHYVDLDNHKNTHASFVKKVSEYRQAYEEGKFLISIEIMNFLKDWLTNHIMGTDQNYSAFLVAKGVK
ncbi:MAG TPA: bacteriohemerythrin [Candidatus Cloacimonadota bacterium]|nr:bacteriohemerythrin [Candidatus Cloacimonadota bacterium]HOQ79597.1 bacteriohemerythrin [Candidatus Cloacimonadota bacterium]HPK40299.1 bacteriohemerythrin [Candidatus Cloacimonadota bacterium]